MNRFKLFFTTLILSVLMAGLYAFKAANISLDHYYIFDNSKPVGEKCVLIDEECDCQVGPSVIDCLTPDGKRMYASRSAINPDLCLEPLYHAE